MANAQQVNILKSGIKNWNQWRRANPHTIPDLTNAYLYDTDLICADLVNANLAGAILHRAWLINAKLGNAILSRTYLDNADLTGAFLTNADLSEASLRHTVLREARLINANLGGAILTGTNLHGADIRGTDFSEAKIGWVSFVSNDLSFIKGLDSVNISGPISVDIESIYRSRTNLPVDFLKRIGIAENFITYLPSLTGQSIIFNSCFISYSNEDLTFASNLYRDLQVEGVQCWFAPESLKIGDKIRHAIDESIRLHDKLLLILSKSSIESQWVESEVEAALARERDHRYQVLFPIRLDNSIMRIYTGWPALIKNTRHIGDFSDWNNSDAYKDSLHRLLRDLKKEASLLCRI